MQTPYPLPSAITIKTIDALAADLAVQSPAAPCFTLDAAQTEIITTPGAQLLLALEKTLGVQGITLAVANAKPAFVQVFTQLGLANHFTQWQVSHD